MIRLYDSTHSQNGYKIRLLLAHLGQPFEYVDIDINNGASRTPAFLAKNIAGRIPALELEDGTVLAESGSILVYLAEGSRFFPPEPTPEGRIARAEVLRWMFFEQNFIECNIGPFLGWQKNGRDKQLAETFTFKVGVAQEALGVMNAHLSTRDWLAAGAFTIADMAVYGYTHRAEAGGFEMTPYPAVKAWLARVAALPGHVGTAWVG